MNQVRRRFVWPGMSADVASYVRACEPCQRSKIVPKLKRPAKQFPVTNRFKTIHIDIVGPMWTTARGHTHLITIIDRVTRWFHAAPTRGTPTAEQVARVLFEQWVCTFGVPEVLISDQGSQFESAVFRELLQLLGIERHRSNPYFPQSNGMIERQHRTLKEALRAHCERRRDQWDKALPAVLYGFHTAVNEDGFSPALLAFGEQLAVPTLMVEPTQDYKDCTQESVVRELQGEMRMVVEQVLRTDRALKGPAAEENERRFPWTAVYLRDPVYKGKLHPPYLGPYWVLETRLPTIVIERDGQPYRVNQDQVKPCWTVEPPPIQRECVNSSSDESVAAHRAPVSPTAPASVPPGTEGDESSSSTAPIAWRTRRRFRHRHHQRQSKLGCALEMEAPQEKGQSHVTADTHNTHSPLNSREGWSLLSPMSPPSLLSSPASHAVSRSASPVHTPDNSMKSPVFDRSLKV